MSAYCRASGEPTTVHPGWLGALHLRGLGTLVRPPKITLRHFFVPFILCEGGPLLFVLTDDGTVKGEKPPPRVATGQADGTEREYPKLH